jgi:valyl-tRNA synthetase
MENNLSKPFSPKDIESRWYDFWESKGFYQAGVDTKNNHSFCILLPPPNVTGTLHMGHGFNQTLMDALTRYHRMTIRYGSQVLITQVLRHKSWLKDSLIKKVFQDMT